MDYKDAKAVLEICEQIGHEDWPVCHGSFDCQWECGKKYNDPPCHKQVGECEHIKQIEPAGIGEIFSVDCGEYLGLTNEMADYIAMAHKALPYWVQEAKRLREENAALLKDINFMGGCPICKSNLGRSDHTGVPMCAKHIEFPNGDCFVWRGLEG